VVVAINRERVHNQVQFLALSALACAPAGGELRIFVFRAGGYEVLTQSCADKFLFRFESFEAR
jgi:hypothetical protein